MITQERNEQGTLVRIDASLDLAVANRARDQLLEAIRQADSPLSLELSDGAPTVPALQLILSAQRCLRDAGTFAGLGPNATTCLGLSADGKNPSFASVRSAA